MQYEYDYHQTLNELGEASHTLLSKPLGAFFNTQIRKQLAQKYLFLVASYALKANGEEFAAKLRQQLNCSTCARFFNRMGAVVYMTSEGAKSVYWNPDVVSDPVMKQVVADMKRFVEGSRIMSLFNQNGAYSGYTEMTNNGDKPFRHYYVDATLMTPRHPLTSVALRIPDASTFNSRVEALVRFAMTTPYSAVTIMEQWLASGTINHVGDSKVTIVLTKQLLAALATLKASTAYSNLDNAYSQESALVNLIWRKALEDQNLLTLKNSLLGVTISKIVALETAGRTDQGIKDIIAAWKVQSDGLHHRRPVAAASSNDVARAQNYLEENDYIRSLEQVETAEDMIPVLWESAGAFTEQDEVKAAEGGFANFASAKIAGGNTPKGIHRVPGATDAGYFFNEILPHIESMAVAIPVETRLAPTFINTMAQLDAKPIFVYDTPDKRVPHVMYRYDSLFNMEHLATPAVEKKGNLYIVNILSVTTGHTVGMSEADAPIGILFMLEGLKCPVAPGPVLFSSGVKGDLYDYRRTLEEFMKTTKIPRCTGHQAVAFPIGPVDPRANNNGRVSTLAFTVKFKSEYAVLMGHTRALYTIDLGGHHVTPDLSKFPVITDRWVKPAEVTEEPAMEDTASAAAPIAQPVQ